MSDKILGGLADHKSDKDFNPKALAKGMKVEREHTSSDAVAKEIARDHLTEDPAYYDKLEKIEKKAFWSSFNKVASLGGFVGKIVGGARRAPTQMASAIKSVPSKVEGATEALKQRAARDAREFSVMQSRALGPQMRKAQKQQAVSNLNFTPKGKAKLSLAPAKPNEVIPYSKKLDFSDKVRAAQEAKAMGQVTPARAAANKASTGVISKARNLATLGATAGGVGMYYGLKDKPQYEQSGP